MKTASGIIYIATNNINGKNYIGQTIKKLDVRIKTHKRDSKRFDYLFYRAINKYGFNNFSWKILYIVPIDKLDIAEVCAIYSFGTYGNGYNSTRGGDDNPMYNPISAKKVSEALRGRKLSFETRMKISKANMGNKLPARSKKWCKEKSNFMMGNKYNLGKRHSVDTKKKLSEAKLKYTYEITSPNGKKSIVKNLRQFCIENSLDPGAMYRVSNNKSSHHKRHTVKKILAGGIHWLIVSVCAAGTLIFM